MGCISNTHPKQNFTGLGARATACGTSKADATISIDTYNEYMLRLYQLVTEVLSGSHFTDVNTEVNRLVNLTKVLRR